jgi:hypothetical protein
MPLQRRGISCSPPSTRRRSPTLVCPAWWVTGTTTGPRRAAAGPSSGTPRSASTSAPSPTPATSGATGSYSGRCTGRTQCCVSFLPFVVWILFCPLCCGSFSALCGSEILDSQHGPQIIKKVNVLNSLMLALEVEMLLTALRSLSRSRKRQILHLNFGRENLN